MIELKKISDVFDVGSSKRVFKSEWTSEGVPFYRAREVVKLSKNGYVDNELFISEEMFQEYSNKYGVPKSGDILVTGVGTLGVCYQVKDHDRFYFKDGNIVWLKKRENVSSDYIEYCFKSPFVKRQIQSTADAAVVGTYTITNARNTKIPLPPLDQQKKIAAILDAADAYRQKTKALIEKYDELTQSLFLDMFGDPLVNSKNWATEQFGNVINEMQNGIGKGKEHYGSGTKVANIGDLYTSYDFKPVKYSLLDVSNKEINKYCLKYGDLLFVRSSLKKEGVAVCSFYNSEETCLFSSFMIKASPKLDILNPYFLSIQMRTPSYRIYIVNAANTATITNISQPNLKELNIIIPPMDLQNQFAERVQAIEAQKAQAQASLAQAEDLFNSLLQRAFKGELV